MAIETFDIDLGGRLSDEAQGEIGEAVEKAIEARMAKLGLSMDKLQNYHYTLSIPISLDLKD